MDTVSQRVRDAASDFAQKIYRLPGYAEAIRRGDLDDAPIVQAFARFEASLTPDREAVAETIRDAVVDGFTGRVTDAAMCEGEYYLADAILALFGRVE